MVALQPVACSPGQHDKRVRLRWKKEHKYRTPPAAFAYAGCSTARGRGLYSTGALISVLMAVDTCAEEKRYVCFVLLANTQGNGSNARTHTHARGPAVPDPGYPGHHQRGTQSHGRPPPHSLASTLKSSRQASSPLPSRSSSLPPSSAAAAAGRRARCSTNALCRC